MNSSMAMQRAINTLKYLGVMEKDKKKTAKVVDEVTELEGGGPESDSFDMVHDKLFHKLLEECEKERRAEEQDNKEHLTQCLKYFTAFFTNVLSRKKPGMKIGSIEFKDHYSESVTLEYFLENELKGEAKAISNAWEELRDKQIHLKLKNSEILPIEDSFKERLEKMGPESKEFDMVERKMLHRLLTKCNDERVYYEKQGQKTAVLARCLENLYAFFENIRKKEKELYNLQDGMKIVRTEFNGRYGLNAFLMIKLEDEVKDTSKPWNNLRGTEIELMLTGGKLIKIKDKRKEEQEKQEEQEEQTTNRQKDEM